jgi:hypothetical protein
VDVPRKRGKEGGEDRREVHGVKTESGEEETQGGVPTTRPLRVRAPVSSFHHHHSRFPSTRRRGRAT